MIPKIIHFCWFGGNPLPELAQRCIESWRKYMPDYEIYQWSENDVNVNEGTSYDTLRDASLRHGVNSYATEQGSYDNEDGTAEQNKNKDKNKNEDSLPFDGKGLYDRRMVFDVNIIPYTAEAYQQKKYAFVSDYARFWILYRYGGIYFDTDVEVIRPMDDIIARGNFMGFEVDPDGVNTPGRYAPRYCFGVNPGVGIGMEKGHPFLKQMLDLYDNLQFQPVPKDIAWYKTIVAYTTEELCRCGLKNVQGIQIVDDISIYPSDFFSPTNVISNRIHITENTYTIHRFAGSWGLGNASLFERIKHYMPESLLFLVNKMKRKRYVVE